MPGTPPWHRTTWRLSVFYLLLTELKEGSDEAGGALIRPVVRRSIPESLPPFPLSPLHQSAHRCSLVTSLAATRDLVEESEENNNRDVVEVVF